MSIQLLVKEYPHRAFALKTETHVLIFRHSPTASEPYNNGLRSSSQTSLASTTGSGPKCMVEFAELSQVNLSDFRNARGTQGVHGTLGLMSIAGDVFLCVVSGASKVAQVRRGEDVLRIHTVEFHCLNRTDYDHELNHEINTYPTDDLDDDGFDHAYGKGRGEAPIEHPCLTLKKLLSSGTFYYSADFDVTRRLQDRANDTAAVVMDSLDAGFLWNSYMIQPLVEFRSRLSPRERTALDNSRFLTSAIRGFVNTIPVPASSSPARSSAGGLPSTLTLISRLSCRRAGTRFNSRGIDDDGNVANFVETETIFCTPAGLCFSYTQARGSVPVFWEQATGLLPNQQKISITRSPEATQPAFDKHIEALEYSYGAIHIINLLSFDKPQEVDLTRQFLHHISRSPLSRSADKGAYAGHELLRHTEYDFHAETRGPDGYEAASQISRYIHDSAESFAYYLSEEIEDHPRSGQKVEQRVRRPVTILQQEGVFRTNCLDCLDRTNLVQTVISKMALTTFLSHRSENGSQDFWFRHGSLWADNGDALSKIYAGTGALKSSFTRHGKMSLAGALADARKSAQRVFINNFQDKGRQNTIELLLGRQMGQLPVTLFDPINDFVVTELNKRVAEYSGSDTINIWAGTYNLNGKMNGIREDLRSWLCPSVDKSQQFPEVVAVGFQEIVELNPQQIMSTDPTRRQAWEHAVQDNLNHNAQMHGQEEYVLLRGGQLVGASLSIFVKSSKLGHVKNVEGSLKKTGMSGVAGNKGAVAIRMDYNNTSLCFVTAHLAAGFSNYDERNRDYKTIIEGLRFQRSRSIEDHDSVIWLGDFNYRIGLSNDKVRRFIDAGDLESLYANDQLNLQMVAGLTFPFYNEARITFLPTYKFDLGSDTYDTSEKSRIPAWCDRILTKGTNLRQIQYNSAPLRFSDHRPVYATFLCTVNIIDERRKELLTGKLYQQRRAAIGDPTANLVDESSDEDLMGYESIEPGLPPASSDRRKWWLDNGAPARSQIAPPKEGMTPNPNRPSNPFGLTQEADWVDVTKPRQPLRTSTQTSLHQTPPKQIPRKLPPPYNGTQNPSLPARFDGTNDIPPSTVPPDLNRSSSRASMYSLPSRPRSPSQLSISSTSTTRKPAPPIPKKPLVLSSPASPPAQTKTPPQLPPPRRSGTTAIPTNDTATTAPNLGRKMPPAYAVEGTNGHGSEEAGPPLPQRRTTGLMDQGLEDSDDLKGWEVLRPN